METFFDRVATQWDELRKTLFDDRLRDRAIAAAGLTRGDRALDVGAGTGFLSEALLAMGARVTAVDSSAAMIDELRRKFGDGVETHVADGRTLPLPDYAMDAALANMYLHHAEDPATAIAEMARVVKSGGRVVVTDMDEHKHAWLAREHHDRWMGFQRSDVETWMKDAGLESVLVGDSAESCCATSACGEKATLSVFLAVGRKPETPTNPRRH